GLAAKQLPKVVVGQVTELVDVFQAFIDVVATVLVFQNFVDGASQQPVKADGGLMAVDLPVHLMAAVDEVLQRTQAFGGDGQPQPGRVGGPANPQVIEQVIQVKPADGDR